MMSLLLSGRCMKAAEIVIQLFLTHSLTHPPPAAAELSGDYKVREYNDTRNNLSLAERIFAKTITTVNHSMRCTPAMDKTSLKQTT